MIVLFLLVWHADCKIFNKSFNIAFTQYFHSSPSYSLKKKNCRHNIKIYSFINIRKNENLIIIGHNWSCHSISNLVFQFSI